MKLVWRRLQGGTRVINYGPESGLFRDEILVASYQRVRYNFRVYQCLNGREGKEENCFVVLTKKRAIKMCVDIAKGAWPPIEVTENHENACI